MIASFAVEIMVRKIVMELVSGTQFQMLFQDAAKYRKEIAMEDVTIPMTTIRK